MNKSSASSKRRPFFHMVVLSVGFVAGGFMTHLARKFLPMGAAKEFMTTAVRPELGPIHIDLIIVNFALGPIAFDVSLLSLVGVLIAYLIARSLF
jgi:uncharacterized protein DUF4321